jgi:hypothetical protein
LLSTSSSGTTKLARPSSPAPVVLRHEEAERSEAQAIEHRSVATPAEIRTFGADEDRAEVVRRRAEDRVSQLLVELHVEEVARGGCNSCAMQRVLEDKNMFYMTAL